MIILHYPLGAKNVTSGRKSFGLFLISKLFFFNSEKHTSDDNVPVSSIRIGGHSAHRVLSLKIDLSCNPSICWLLDLQGQEDVLVQDVHKEDVLTQRLIALHATGNENSGCIQFDTAEATEEKAGELQHLEDQETIVDCTDFQSVLLSFGPVYLFLIFLEGMSQSPILKVVEVLSPPKENKVLSELMAVPPYLLIDGLVPCRIFVTFLRDYWKMNE